MRIIFKRPAEKVGHFIDVPNTLASLQALVDGHIEIVRLDHENVAIVNEEGVIQQLPYNCSLFTERNGERVCIADLMGNIVIAGLKGEDFTDVKMTLEEWRKMHGWRK